MMPDRTAFLVDILDSAQEAEPAMWVNGEKYVFSECIVEDGVELYQKLQQINVTIPEAKSISDLYALKALIESFDRLWCKYESAYVGELMVIERDARRYLYDLCDNKDEPELFFAALGHLNSVANTQGQGR